MIDNKLQFYQTRAGYDAQAEAGNIPNDSLVFVKETHEIITHGEEDFGNSDKYGDVAYIGDQAGTAITPEFNPQDDTVWTKDQVLSDDKKDAAQANILNKVAGDGMGKVVLKKNMVSGVNTLTQDMFYKTEGNTRVPNINTIFIIKYNYTLAENITIPANCVLQFDGGSISGEHTITGANTGIQAGLVEIFSTDLTLAGTWNVAENYPEWFGAVGDGVNDDTNPINKCIDFGLLGSGIIKLLGDIYKITSTIFLKNNTALVGRLGSTRYVTSSCIKVDLANPYDIAISTYVTDKNTGEYLGVDWAGGDEADNGNVLRVSVKNLSIIADSPAYIGLRAAFCHGAVFENIEIKNFFIGLRVQREWGATYTSIRIDGCPYGIIIGRTATLSTFNSVLCTCHLNPSIDYSSYSEWRQTVINIISTIYDFDSALYSQYIDAIGVIGYTNTYAVFNGCSIEGYKIGAIAHNISELSFNVLYVEDISGIGFIARRSSILINGMVGDGGNLESYMYDATNGTGRFLLIGTQNGTIRKMSVTTGSFTSYIFVGTNAHQDGTKAAYKYENIYLGSYMLTRIPEVRKIVLNDAEGVGNTSGLGAYGDTPITGATLCERGLNNDYTNVNEIYITGDVDITKLMYIERDTRIIIKEGATLKLSSIVWLNGNLEIVGSGATSILDFYSSPIRVQSAKNVNITFKNILIKSTNSNPNSRWLIYVQDTNNPLPAYLTVNLISCTVDSTGKNVLCCYSDKIIDPSYRTTVSVIQDTSVVVSVNNDGKYVAL